jgi:hypothetical protein
MPHLDGNGIHILSEPDVRPAPPPENSETRAKSRRRIAAATPYGRNIIVEELPAKIQYTVR